MVNENRPKCLWKFILHCTYELSLRKDKIKSHEIVYFRHTRHGGLIASTLARQNYYLKEHTDIAQCGKCPESSECFWELVPKKVNEFGPEKCNLFWARNIVTGQILTFGGFQVEIQSKEEVEGGGFNSEGQVNLVCTQTGALLERGQMIMANEQTPPIVKRFEESVKKL